MTVEDTRVPLRKFYVLINDEKVQVRMKDLLVGDQFMTESDPRVFTVTSEPYINDDGVWTVVADMSTSIIIQQPQG